MLEIDEYIEYQSKIKDTFNCDLDFIKHIYLNLGHHFYFDPAYFFGNSKYKRKLYKSITKDSCTLNYYFKTGCIICKSLSYVCEYIFNNLGFQTDTLIEFDDIHTYNSINVNGNVYFLDLQLDLRRIQLNLDPKFFLYTSYQNVSNSCAYINYAAWTSDNMCQLKSFLKTEKNEEKVLNYIIQNIYPNLKFPGYIERTGVYKEILFDIFSCSNLYTKLHFCTCYDNSKKYISIISFNLTSSIHYIFDDKLYKYVCITEEIIKSMLKTNLKILSGAVIINGKIITKNSNISKI